jgi:hypothetical protein
MTAHDVLCQKLGQPHNDITFDPSPGWDGGCDKTDPVDAGFGIQSLSIDPLIIKDSCAVGPPPPALKLFDPSWTTDAVDCPVHGWWECDGNPRARCIPNERPEGFEVCVTFPDDVHCDKPPWTKKAFFYGDWKDNRECSDCTCGPPVGSDCKAMISVYNDNACQVLQASNDVSSAPNFCDNVPPGMSLGSKSSMSPVYIPGTCLANGGVPNGGIAEPIMPTTFCCLP